MAASREWPYVQVRALALAACLAVALGAVPSRAAEKPPQPTPPEAGSGRKSSVAGAVLDTTHAKVERSILDRVIWFDNFFGTVRTEESRPTEYELRWRNSVRWEEGGRFRFRTSVRARARLPRISNRLHLVVFGENEAEPSLTLPEDPGNPGFDQTLANTSIVNTEVRYNIVERPTTVLFLGTGVRVKLPFEYFARSRLLYTHPIGTVNLARFRETVFWRNKDGFGETTEFSLERQLHPKSILRWANAATLSESSSGLEWGSELSLQHRFSARSAGTVGGGVTGNTRPVAVVQGYRIFMRFRRNFYRTWLFYELEPEVTWPRDDRGRYTSAFAATVRLDVVFRGSEAKERSQGQ